MTVPHRNLLSHSSVALAVSLILSACSEGGGPAGNAGGTASGGTTGGQTGTGAQASTGAHFSTGGHESGGNQSGGKAGQTGGSSSGGASGGTFPRGGNQSGGAATGGASGGHDTGGSSGGMPGSGGTSNGECTRSLLDDTLDDYFSALSAGDPSTLPLAPDVKFTENAQETTIGSTDFWMNAGEAKYSQRALDTVECTAAAQAVIPEGTTDLPIGIRIKMDGTNITEVETIVVRQGDYTADFAVDNDPDAIIAIASDIGWHDVVPEDERATREELLAWVDKYFRMFPSGVCNVTSECKRLENGGGNYDCSGLGATCSSGDPGPDDAVFEPRLLLADVERGIAVGFTIFDYMTTGHLDMHMIKMAGGEVHAVQAILRDTGGESGWE